MAWDRILINREKGGLNVGSLKALNIVVLAKWWWRFRTEDDTIWKKAIVAIYGDNGALGEVTRPGCGKGVWVKLLLLIKL